MVTLLLKNCADLEMTGRKGESCLTCTSQAPLLKNLINAGARVNRMRADGATAINYQASMGNIYGTELLLRNGAIMRRDKDGYSTIMSAAVSKEKQIVQFLSEFTDNGNISTFERRSNQSRDMPSFLIELMEKIDAYKLLGASYGLDQLQDTINAWSKAVSMCDRSIIRPKEHDSHSSLCVCRTSMNTKEGKVCAELSKSVETWYEINLAAQEMITGSEMLQNSIRSNEPAWMSDFLPRFSCPTSISGHYVFSAENLSVSQKERYGMHNKDYLLKWPHLQRELHSLYSDREELQRFHSRTCTKTSTESSNRGKIAPISEVCSAVDGKSYMRGDWPSIVKLPTNNGVSLKLSSIADLSLGIEPVCFVPTRNHLNDLDPQSYYLQRCLLLSGCLIHPRTRYRCLYRLCFVCGHIFNQFGGVYPLQSRGFNWSLSDLVCKRCRLTFRETRNQTFAVSELPVTKSCYREYCNSASFTYSSEVVESTKNVNRQISQVTFCERCGLVSEQHPQLKRLRQCIEETFGDVNELTSKEELEDIMTDSTAILTQKTMIKLRMMGRNDSYEILQLFDGHAKTTDITTGMKLLRYAYQFAKTFHLMHRRTFKSFPLSLRMMVSRVLEEEKDVSIRLPLVTDYLEVIIRVIERQIQRHINPRDEKDRKMYDYRYVNGLIQYSIHLISSVPLFHRPQLPFPKSPLHGQRLIDFLVKEYCQDINIANEHFQSSRFLNKMTQKTGTGSNNEVTSTEQLILSAVDVHSFISQVHRLVYLSPEFFDEGCILHVACSEFFKVFHINVNISTIELLLRLGADPNCVNVEGETIVGNFLKKSWRILNTYPLFTILVNADAHLDAYRRSPAYEYPERKLCLYLRQHNICPVRNTKLTCLVATAMRRNGLTSRLASVKTLLPLWKFIKLH